MSAFFSKLRLWTRMIVLGALGIYLILFIALNWGITVEGELNFMFVKFTRPRILFVLLVTAVVSIFGWWLFRTVFKTIRQLRDVGLKKKTEQLEKEVAEMKVKANMLQTKEAPAGTGATPPPAA